MNVVRHYINKEKRILGLKRRRCGPKGAFNRRIIARVEYTIEGQPTREMRYHATKGWRDARA